MQQLEGRPDPMMSAAGEHPLARALDRLHRHLDRFGHRLTASDGRLDDLYVSLAEARRTLRVDPPPAATGLGPAPTALSPRPPALEAFADAFALAPIEREILLLAAAPGLDRDLARLYCFAWADFTLKLPTAGFLAELAADGPAERDRALAALRPDRPLVRHRLVRLHATEHWRPDPPLLHRGVTVPEPVLARLRGEPPLLDPHGAGRLVRPEAPAEALCIEPAAAARLTRAWHRALAARRPAVVLVGQRGSGRRSAIEAACAAAGRSLLIVDPARVPAEALAETLAEAAREARASGAGLLVRGDALLDDSPDALLGALGRAIEATPVPLALTARRIAGPLRRALGELAVVELPPLTAPDQVALWRRALGEADDARAHRLAARFSMPPGVIVDTAAEVGRSDDSRPIDDSHAIDGDDPCVPLLQSRIDHALDAVADPVRTTLDWGDVVLTAEVREALEEIRSQARHRARVFDEWGFRRKLAYGRGLACLFAGPPGTGKTMMAGILANDLGRALYRVDLSRIVSKWVGETEKNLARVFDEAERAQVILFFDEADSLFSTRTEVKGANDRFANMEVNYLLQRMEQFDGISILTTNFERSIDDAFKRRLRFRVHFPLPDADERAELWRRMVPSQMACADNIRWDVLGKRYKFSGGSIKNAVLRAAFYAADGEGALTDALLEKAAEAERREMGRL